MSLLTLPSLELENILKERRLEFDSFRINKKAETPQVVKEETIPVEIPSEPVNVASPSVTSVESPSESSAASVATETVTATEEVVEKGTKSKSTDELVVNEAVKETVKQSSGIDSIKPYNERMKSGYFGRRRSR